MISVTNESFRVFDIGCRVRRHGHLGSSTARVCLVAIDRRCGPSSVDRRAAGKSARKWPPRLSSRRSAARAISRATVSRLNRRQSSTSAGVAGRSRRARPRRRASSGATASRSPSRVRNRPADRHIRSRIAVGLRSCGLTRLRRSPRRGSQSSSLEPRPRRDRLAAAPPRGGCCIASPRGRRRPALRAASCSPGGWRRGRRCRPSSPAANRPGSDVRPHSSVSTPPIM